MRFADENVKWNSSRVRYHLNYPYEEFMADDKKREEFNQKETMKQLLSEKLQKKFTYVT